MTKLNHPLPEQLMLDHLLHNKTVQKDIHTCMYALWHYLPDALSILIA
jgi:hypothetical protein